MKKGIALMMGVIMIATLFAAMPTGKAWTLVPVNTENANGDNMVEIGTYSATPDPFYPGQQDRTIRLWIYVVDDPGLGVGVNRAMITAQSVRGPDGQITTNAIHWDVNSDDGPTGTGYTIPSWSGQWTIDFQFDIDPNQANVPPGTYNITFKIDYEYDDDADGGAATPEVAATEYEYMEFEIAPNIDVTDAYPVLYAGQTFTPLNIDVDDVWNGVHNLYLNLSNIPTGITFDSTTGWIPGDVETDTIGFRVDVDRDMPPGIYTVDYQVQYYNNDGIWCTETGTLDITVEFTPVIEAALTGDEITIEQGTDSISALGVRFTNTGNVDLRNLVIDLDYDGYFFFAPADFYEGNTGSNTQNPVRVTEIEVDSLGIGESTTGEWFVAIDPYVQDGQHRILFDWSATFFDDGATDNPTHYVDVDLWWWDDDGNPNTPLVPRCSLLADEWIAGPYVMIGVIDNNPDFTADKIENVDTWDDYFDLSWNDLTYVEIGTNINNYEMVDYSDLRATLHVGPGTPFWNPLDHEATTVENDIWNSDDYVSAGGSAWMTWYVDLNPETMPGIYTVQITVSGRNVDTTMWTNTTIDAVVEVRGFGPELVITSFVTGDIEPGKIFYLNLTVENLGDDTARDVFVTIPGNVGYSWDVIDGFVSAISSNDNNKMVSVPNGWYYNESGYWPGWGWYGYEYLEDGSLNKTSSKSTEYSGVTLEQLNISDAKDIVDLALYIEGVFNSPTAQIWVMKADNLAPGESVTLSFRMMTNINLVEGRPYVIDVAINYVDSYGDGPGWMLETQEITIRSTNPGTPYHAVEAVETGGISDENLMLLGIILLVILLIIVAVALAGSRGGKRKKHQPDSYETVETPQTVPEEPMVEEETVPEEIPPEETEEPGFTLEEKEGESSF